MRGVKITAKDKHLKSVYSIIDIESYYAVFLLVAIFSPQASLIK